MKYSIFGESHGPAIGVVLEGVPSGIELDMTAIQKELDRRRPGKNSLSTARKEADVPKILSGVFEGRTTGTPLCAVIENGDQHSADYEATKDLARPGHADWPARVRYGGCNDYRGGGHFSGRLTAPLVFAGAVARQILAQKGIKIGAHIFGIGDAGDDKFDWLNPQLEAVDPNFPVINPEAGEQMRQIIAAAKADGDSVGGLIQCAVTGLPAGLGEPMFGGVESKLSQIIYGIPAVKGLWFGDGMWAFLARGSEFNDAFSLQDGRISTVTNHNGGILGGITTGMPVLFHVAIKPTPSISKTQQSISLTRKQEQELTVNGRHDPCIVPRAVPVIEAAAAVAIYDLILSNTQTDRRKP